MKPYTVLLLLPDYLATDYGQETHLSHEIEETPRKAIRAAQLGSISAVGKGAPHDWYPLAVFEGHLEDKKP